MFSDKNLLKMSYRGMRRMIVGSVSEICGAPLFVRYSVLSDFDGTTITILLHHNQNSLTFMYSSILAAPTGDQELSPA